MTPSQDPPTTVRAARGPTVTVNGEPTAVDPGTTIGTLVDAAMADRRGIAVAVDGEVVPRTRWDEVTVPEGARIELVGASQGG